ncbi:MAG: hypothetical protein HC876_20930 [Chloroflexaceae bacterium]|nr:hypothetical protein [Chloroflexaceae bacterium]NJO07782.1 hypothetical protein [Chloroflexaceae bacterium]
MSVERFHEQARAILYRMLNESHGSDPNILVDAYANMLTQLHMNETHELLNDVLNDAKTRLDARLSPDPVTQGIASVQTTMQDLWRSLWKE